MTEMVLWLELVMLKLSIVLLIILFTSQLIIIMHSIALRSCDFLARHCPDYIAHSPLQALADKVEPKPR